ncbi:Remorin C domain-containing protein [Citrus sinensis]|uniref:Remorin C domain-containing protein n=1 Tax=Citrus sinensis TaxID=2711 RepID=A0ACB8J7Y1_CITSI|nr:Remorin C domain-containing protein [Citrus sinensis]
MKYTFDSCENCHCCFILKGEKERQNWLGLPVADQSHQQTMDRNTSLCGKSKGNPFAVVDTFDDPLCKLNLKETSEFVKSFPVAVNDNSISAQRRGVNSVIQRRIEAPPTPGRPVFSFSVGNFSRKNVPSKWDDADKWLNSTSCHGSPAHPIKPVPIPIPESSKNQKQVDNFKQQMVVFSEKSRVTEEKASKVISSFQSSLSLDHHNSASAFNGVSVSTDVFLKDKFADEVQSVLPNFKYSEPSREGFLFRNTNGETMKDVATEVIHEVQHRDVGTEMTPLGSSTVSRCHTPFTSSSPARHNTPANRSGPLALGHSNSINSTVDISQLQECHLAKLQLGTQYDSVPSNWSSREEEEEEISKSLRHFETGSVYQKNTSDSRAAAWEEEEKTKCCLRYQREEAKIQAWVNLQSAKAEAQSKKLEVKIQKMRSNLEEKLMKRMVVVHRRAEEWRAAARQQHAEQIQKAGAQAQKIINRHNTHISVHSSCGCFPCNNYQ